MKTLTAFFTFALSLSAFAMVELPLKTIENADLYHVDQTTLSYSTSAYATLELITKGGLRGHPELSIETYLISRDLVSFEDGEFIARSGEAEAVCATLENNKVYETGDCEFRVEVKNNRIHTSLFFHE